MGSMEDQGIWIMGEHMDNKWGSMASSGDQSGSRQQAASRKQQSSIMDQQASNSWQANTEPGAYGGMRDEG